MNHYTRLMFNNIQFLGALWGFRGSKSPPNTKKIHQLPVNMSEWLEMLPKFYSTTHESLYNTFNQTGRLWHCASFWHCVSLWHCGLVTKTVTMLSLYHIYKSFGLVFDIKLIEPLQTFTYCICKLLVLLCIPLGKPSKFL